MAMPSALHKKEQDMTKAKSTFRSANQTPSNKARWVNRWMAFHRAFPDVSIGEWCGLNNLSHHTFQNWLRDPKLNREKRIKAKIVKLPHRDIQGDPHSGREQDHWIRQLNDEASRYRITDAKDERSTGLNARQKDAAERQRRCRKDFTTPTTL